MDVVILEQMANTFFGKGIHVFIKFKEISKKNEVLRLLDVQTSSMDIDGIEKLDISQKVQNLPEVELYLNLLVLIFLIDNQKWDKVYSY